LKITQERLKEILSYDSDTGFFKWLVSRGRNGNGARVGQIAGTKDVTGRITITIEGRHYRAHRLAWLYVYGRLPNGELDHRNGVQSDNRCSNLREATKSQNAANKRVLRAGLKGACFNRRRDKWMAAIRKDYKQIHLGYFATEQEAHAAYVEAANKLHGEFVRPR